jgi:hypothetical protein
MLQDALKIIRGKNNATSAELRTALGRLNIDEARQAVERLEATRQQLLIDGDDKQVDTVEKQLTTARRDVERSTVAIAELEQRLATAEAAELALDFVECGRCKRLELPWACRSIPTN